MRDFSEHAKPWCLLVAEPAQEIGTAAPVHATGPPMRSKNSRFLQSVGQTVMYSHCG